MKFSIGDRVVLKQTGEEGFVSAYINNQMVEVDVNGTLFPVYIDEIDHPYLKWFTEKKKAAPKPAPKHDPPPAEKEKFRKPRLARGIYLSFLPVFKLEEMEDMVDHLKVYLQNELPDTIKFDYEVRTQHESIFHHSGILHGFGHIFLHNVPYEAMNDQPRFHWKMELTFESTMEPAFGILRIKPRRLIQHIEGVLFNNEPTFSYKLVENFVPHQKKELHIPKKIQPLENPNLKPLVSTADLEQPKHEIDLHIEKLVKNHRGMSNAEMLNIQMNTLQHYVHLAIAHRLERMVIIHGIGIGRLREMVHEYLKTVPEVRKYENEWYGKYGFGATEVWFKR